MSKVDICMTTYRNVDKLKTCLKSMVEKTKFVDYKIYLLANTPNEEMKKVIHDSMFLDDIKFTDRIIPVFNDTNEGSFSQNNNEIASEGDGDLILFANDDLEVVNDTWLLSMTQMLNDPNIGVVGALLLYPNKKIQHCGVFFSEKTNNLPFHIHYQRNPKEVKDFISVPRYYQAVTAACMLVRRKDFETVGGFSTEYNYGFEDCQFCLDVKQKLKKKCVYTPNAVLIHNEGISGTFKKHPHLQKNIEAFRKNCAGKYYNDLDFYLSNPNFMVYNK
jgi:GT2 family glycosyltransferase